MKKGPWAGNLKGGDLWGGVGRDMIKWETTNSEYGKFYRLIHVNLVDVDQEGGGEVVSAVCKRRCEELSRELREVRAEMERLKMAALQTSTTTARPPVEPTNSAQPPNDLPPQGSAHESGRGEVGEEGKAKVEASPRSEVQRDGKPGTPRLATKAKQSEEGVKRASLNGKTGLLLRRQGEGTMTDSQQPMPTSRLLTGKRRPAQESIRNGGTYRGPGTSFVRASAFSPTTRTHLGRNFSPR